MDIFDLLNLGVIIVIFLFIQAFLAGIFDGKCKIDETYKNWAEANNLTRKNWWLHVDKSGWKENRKSATEKDTYTGKDYRDWAMKNGYITRKNWWHWWNSPKESVSEKTATSDNDNEVCNGYKGTEYKTPLQNNIELTGLAKKNIIETDYSNDIIEVLKRKGYDIKLINKDVSTRITYYIFESAYIPIDKLLSYIKEFAYYHGLNINNVKTISPFTKAAFKIEITNTENISSTQTWQIINLKETISHIDNSMHLQIPIGKNTQNETYSIDLYEATHILIAGTTGSGKSICLLTIISSLIYRYSPKELKLLLIDTKRVELGQFKELPHLLAPPLHTVIDIFNALEWLEKEMNNRYEMLGGKRNIIEYNENTKNKMPYIVVVIDEFYNLMVASQHGKLKIEEYISTIASMSRAVGIHLIVSTQRPSKDCITGIVKANLPTKIAFKVANKTNSRIILDENGAEDLTGKGDALIQTPYTEGTERVQVSLTTTENIKEITDGVLSQGHKYETHPELYKYIYGQTTKQ